MRYNSANTNNESSIYIYIYILITTNIWDKIKGKRNISMEISPLMTQIAPFDSFRRS
jgi:hypothetical protein